MMLKYNIPFQLFACCIPVKGYARSIICDVQRNSYYFIPNSLYEIIIKYEGVALKTIFSGFNKEDRKIVEEYFSYLLDNELIFFSEIHSSFPKIKEEWIHPSKITNAIIDIGERYIEFDYEKIINDLSKLGCKAIEFRFYCIVPNDFLMKIVQFNNENRIRDVQIVMKYNQNDDSFYANLYELNERLSSIKVHSAPFVKSINLNESGLFKIHFSNNEFVDATCCGFISPNQFNSNIDLFMEAKHFNTCLNRKIGIDINGEIKNCPSFNKSFGNISNTEISVIIEEEDFKDFWHVKKDLINTCKDCEFRYMCTDCRYSDLESFGKYDKPQKCLYNPYTCEWDV